VCSPIHRYRTILCAFLHFFQNVRGRDHQLFKPEIAGADAQAKAEQLGDIDNRNLIIFSGLLVDVLLPANRGSPGTSGN
jgi:hypothetical protein